jgi:predicted glycosyltransferase
VKIALDILTPKQGMLFSKLSERLEQKGHQVLRTTRKYREVNQLLKLKGLDAKVLGEHGGKNVADKLKASAQRTLELASYLEKAKPDVAVSFSSPEMARTAYGLGIPHICVNDSPHAEAVARLTVPLSEKLLTPKMIPKKEWIKYGIAPARIIQYNALDPWAWLKDFKPDKRIVHQLGLDKSRPLLTFRTEESHAAYLLSKTRAELAIVPILKQVLKKAKDIQVVVVPRYDDQIKVFRSIFNDRVIVCESTVDGPSLLHYTSIFIGGGGTMTAESALLGVPTFSCYPDKPVIILKYLIRNGLVRLETDPSKLLGMIQLTLDNLDEEKKRQAEKAERLVKGFEDPIEAILKEIESPVWQTRSC